MNQRFCTLTVKAQPEWLWKPVKTRTQIKHSQLPCPDCVQRYLKVPGISKLRFLYVSRHLRKVKGLKVTKERKSCSWPSGGRQKVALQTMKYHFPYAIYQLVSFEVDLVIFSIFLHCGIFFRLFFVIDFVRGGDLMFHMQRQRRLPEDHARFYSAEISLALNFLHGRGEFFQL